MKYILTTDHDLVDFEQYGGGKATNLKRLLTLDVKVPDWFCVSTDAYDAFVEQNNLGGVLQQASASKDSASQIDVLFQKGSMPEAITKQVQSALQHHQLEDHFVAVRSSGLDEDSDDHSFAGQFSTYLYQKGMPAILNAIKACWASAFSERALAYRKEHQLSTQHIKMGVIIQKMVHSTSAGVAFSKNPVSPLNRTHVIVDAVFGQGEGLVSGLLDADHFTWNRETHEIEQTIAKKECALHHAPEGGLREVAVPTDEQEQPSLSEAQVLDIAQIAILLEQDLASPQDIEWAYDEQGVLHILQARPITNLPSDAFFDPTINGKEAILWDNSNIVESYSGVTSPFTFSFASRAYRQVYVQFCEVMGVPQTMIEEHDAMFRNMLGSIRGHIYYNLVNWYRLVQMLPGLGSNASFLETMMGVRKSLKPEVAVLFDFMNHPPAYSFPKRVQVISKSIWRFIRMPAILRSFWTQFNKIYDESRQLNFRNMPLPALMNHYQYLNDEVLKKWHAPIINDYFCMIFFGLLKKLTDTWIAEGEANQALQNDLLCGEGDLESTEPTKMLMRIAAQIDKGDSTIKSWFLRTPANQLWEDIEKNKKPLPIYKAITAFLDAYGFRCVNELKLEEPDLHDNPAFIIASISSYLRTSSFDIEAMEKRERVIRREAEAIVHGKIRGPKRWIFKWVLKQARTAVKNRENLRFGRTKIFGISRHLFRAVGFHLTRLGTLNEEQDVFFLTVDELVEYVEGRSVLLNLKELVRLRREEYNTFKAAPPPPDRFITYGTTGLSASSLQILADADQSKTERRESDDPNLLTGTPCCPGIIEGIVRVVTHPSEAEGINKEILVTARTDPGWVPLFPSCSGLLIERGSLLSHSAVVARELGLPTIVGIQGGLMQRLKTGQRVRIDAGKGEVQILEPVVDNSHS